MFSNRKGLPKECLEDTYHALRPIFIKYVSMKKSHMNKYRIIGLMYQAFEEAIKLRSKS